MRAPATTGGDDDAGRLHACRCGSTWAERLWVEFPLKAASAVQTIWVRPLSPLGSPKAKNRASGGRRHAGRFHDGGHTAVGMEPRHPAPDPNDSQPPPRMCRPVKRRGGPGRKRPLTQNLRSGGRDLTRTTPPQSPLEPGAALTSRLLRGRNKGLDTSDSKTPLNKPCC